MKIGTPEDVTRVLGESQGYQPLPVADKLLADGTPCMFTVWHPTPEELKALNSGGHITLGILGQSHPPVMLYVADADGAHVPDGGLT